MNLVYPKNKTDVEVMLGGAPGVVPILLTGKVPYNTILRPVLKGRSV